MLRKRLRYWGLFGLVCLGPYSYAQSELGLERYLELYLKYDEALQQKIQETREGQQNLYVAEDFYQSRFNFRAQRSENDTSFPKFSGQNFAENRNSLTGTYTQNLKWGMQAEFQGRHFIGKSNPALGSIDEEYNISLSQSLWKNPLGKLSLTRQEKFQVQLAQLQIQEKIQLAQSCQKGVETYMKAWSSAESYKIVKEMEDISEQALKSADQAYQKRLMREMDLLSAQSDRIEASELSSRHLTRRDQSFLALINYSKKLGHIELNSKELSLPRLSFPTSFFQDAPESFLPEKSFQVLASEKALEAAQLNYQQVKREQRSDISLGVALGQKEGDVNIGAVVTDFKEESAQVFLEMDWPLFNKTRDAQRVKATLLEKKAEIGQRQTRRKVLESYHDLKTRRRERMKQIEMAFEKIDILQKQVKQAMRLIKTGKIEFEDFARFRRQLLQARLSAVDLRQQLILERVMMASLGPELFESCEELL